MSPSPPTCSEIERAPCQADSLRALTPEVLVGWWKNTYFGYDRSDFTPLWDFKLKESTSFDRTQFTRVEGDQLLVGDVRARRLERHDLRTGDLLEGVDLPTALGRAVACPGRVVASDRKGRHLLAVSLGDDLGEELWRVKIPRLDENLKAATPELVYAENRLYQVSDGAGAGELEGTWSDLDASGVLIKRGPGLEERSFTGELTWAWTLDSEVGRIQSAKLTAGLALVQHTVKTVTRTESATGVSTSVQVDAVLKGLDRESGQVRWELPAEHDGSRLLSWRDLVVIGRQGDEGQILLEGLEPATGEVAWTQSVPLGGWGQFWLNPQGERLEVLSIQVRGQSQGRKPTLDAEFLRAWIA